VVRGASVVDGARVVDLRIGTSVELTGASVVLMGASVVLMGASVVERVSFVSFLSKSWRER
jgi:hypothetical protein